MKYFALSRDGARRYAAMSSGAFGDGPFWLVSTSFPSTLISWRQEVVVDRGIDALALPTAMLRLLSPPLIEGLL